MVTHASMTGAHRTTGHCPLSPCPRLLLPSPPASSSAGDQPGEGFRTPAPSSSISFPPTFLFRFSRESGTGNDALNFLTRVSPFKCFSLSLFFYREGRRMMYRCLFYRGRISRFLKKNFFFLFQLFFYFSMSEKNMYSHCSNIIFGKEEKRNVKFIIASSH